MLARYFGCTPSGAAILVAPKVVADDVMADVRCPELSRHCPYGMIKLNELDKVSGSAGPSRHGLMPEGDAMLVWKDAGGMPNIFSLAAVPDGREGLSAYESYFSSVNRIILRDSARYEFVPNKLSAAMIGAFKAMGGRVVDSIETSYAQWQQYVVCAMQTVARRSRAAAAKPLTVTPVRAVRRVKAFFVSQKVNGRNAP